MQVIRSLHIIFCMLLLGPAVCVPGCCDDISPESKTLAFRNGAIVPPQPPGHDWMKYTYWNCEDTSLDSDKPAANYGSSELLKIGRGTAILVRFGDLNRAIGPNAKILSATLILSAAEGDASGTLCAYRMLRSWGEGSADGSPCPGGANSESAHALWDTPEAGWGAPLAGTIGRDRAGEPSALVVLTDTQSPTEITFSGLEGDLQDMLDRHYANFGWSIVSRKDFAGNLVLWSSEGTPGRRPRLEIEYTAGEAPPNDVDLSVIYIERFPEYYRYDPSGDAYEYKDFAGSACGLMRKPGLAETQKWPSDGEQVRFVAHVKNLGKSRASAPFDYVWKINGEKAEEGRFDGSIQPGAEETFEVEWTWHADHRDHSDQNVSFRVDPDGEVREVTKNNNCLTDYIEACNMGFWAEQSYYDEFNKAQIGWGSYSFEDWVQWQIDIWNSVWMARSRYPLVAPDGSLERVRAQRIMVVPDGTLAGGNHIPGEKTDFLFDGEWGFEWSEENPQDSKNYIEICRLQAERAFLHECSHQLGLNDLYVMNIDASLPDGTRGKVRLKAGGDSVVTRGLIDPYGGLMGGGDTRPHKYDGPRGIAETVNLEPSLDAEPLDLYAAEDAAAYNTNLGKRRGFFGEYMYDLPKIVRVRAVTGGGDPIAFAKMTFYQERDGAFQDDPPVFVLTADEEGIVTLPDQPTLEDRPFTTETGHTLRPNPFGRINVVGANGVLLVKAEAFGQSDWQFIKIHELNVAYWRGNRDSFIYDLVVRIAPREISGTDAAVGMKAGDSRGEAQADNASHICDGDAETRWLADNRMGSFIELDLGEPKSVAGLDLVQRASHGDFWRSFVIEVSRTGEFAGEQKALATEPNWQWTVGHRRDVEPADCELWTVRYRARPVEGRFIRLTSLEDWGGSLSELEVSLAEE